MSETHHAADNTAETPCPPYDSTYVRTIVRIRNTYIHTYLLEANALDFGEYGFWQNNAYCNTLSRGWW